MALVNGSLPSLIGGVSQQPPSMRHPSQMDEVVNMVPSVAKGLIPRNGSHIVGKLLAGDHHQAFVHTINKGTNLQTERFHVIVENGSIKVADFYGGVYSPSTPDGLAYLNCSYPREDIAAVTVEDYTFIVNKTKTVAMASHSYTPPAQTIYYVIKYGVDKTAYTINLGGTDYTFTTAGTFDTDTIAAGVTTAVNGGGTYTATQYGNLVSITKTTPGAFSWFYKDGYGDQASFAFYQQVNRYEQLPAKFVEGPVIEVIGDPNASNDSYFVTWKKDASSADGRWHETIDPNVATAFDATTLPFTLTRNPGTGAWTFQKATWDARKVGNDTSNPAPSFVGQTINDVLFWRDRLGFLSGENVILSRTGHYFDFWGQSARAVLDSDPIDISASTTRQTILRHSVPFDRAVLVFSDKAQFQLVSGDVLSPRTARLEPTTAFETSLVAKPVPLGRNVFFTTDRGRHTALREYYFSGSTVMSDASDVTAHVPTYLPAGIFKLAAAPTEDMIFAIGGPDENVIYCYNSFWNGEEKVQSAWHKWVFDRWDRIISVAVAGATVHLIVQRPSGLYYDAIELDRSPWAASVDNSLKFDQFALWLAGDLNLAYNATTKRTYATLSTPWPIGATMIAVTPIENGQLNKGMICRQETAFTVSFPGDHTATSVFVGVQFDSWFRLSPLTPRDQKGNAMINVKTQVRDFAIQYQDSGYFEARVTPTGRDTSVYEMSGKQLGLDSLVLGTTPIISGRFAVPIMAKSDEVTIEFHNTWHVPSNFLSAEWTGYVAQQAQRQ